MSFLESDDEAMLAELNAGAADVKPMRGRAIDRILAELEASTPKALFSEASSDEEIEIVPVTPMRRSLASREDKRAKEGKEEVVVDELSASYSPKKGKSGEEAVGTPRSSLLWDEALVFGDKAPTIEDVFAEFGGEDYSGLGKDLAIQEEADDDGLAEFAEEYLMSQVGVVRRSSTADKSPVASPDTVRKKVVPHVVLDHEEAYYTLITPEMGARIQYEERVRKRQVTALQKYQQKLTDLLSQIQTEMGAVAMVISSHKRRLPAEYTEYKSWHDPALLKAYRKFAAIQLFLRDLQLEIHTEQEIPVGKRLSDVRFLLQCDSRGEQFLVDERFYEGFSMDTLRQLPSVVELVSIFRRGMAEKTKYALELKRQLANASNASSMGARKKTLKKILSGELDEDEAQVMFDGWLCDERTKEGMQMNHFTASLRQALRSGNALPPEEIVYLVQDFQQMIVKDYLRGKAEDANNMLAILIQRTLFSHAYFSIMRLNPVPNAYERGLEFYRRTQVLRTERTDLIPLDEVYVRDRNKFSPRGFPFHDVGSIFSDLPFCMNPYDAAKCMEKGVRCLCKVCQSIIGKPPAADDVVPCLTFALCHAEITNIEEIMFLVNELAQETEHQSQTGWCIATFQAVVVQINSLPV